MTPTRRAAVAWAVLAALAGAAPTGCADTPEEKTRYFAVRVNGVKVGHGTYVRGVRDGKVTNAQTMQMTLERLGVPMKLRVEETATETAKGKPLSFKSAQYLGPIPTATEGVIDAGGKLQVTVGSASGQRRSSLDWPEGALLPEGARLLQRRMGLKEGTTYNYRDFMPSFLKAVDNHVRVGPTQEVDLLGRVAVLTEIRSRKVVPTLMGPVELETTVYVDKDFQELKAVLPMMGTKFEVLACSRAFALSGDDVLEFFDKLIVTPPVPLEGVATARAIRYHLLPAGGAKLKLPATDSQTVRPAADGAVIVTVRRLRAGRGERFPYKGTDPAAREALKPTRFVESDDKQVAALARRAVAGARDSAEAVARIESFVRKYIRKKDLSVGYATAAEVAASRQGDCSEHAVLAAAMCRAVGIPARVVSGLAHVDRVGKRKDAFVPHAWAQALVAGRWIGVDAALNGHDAGHIALAVGTGGPDDFFGMVHTLGGFRIAKVVVEK